MDDDVRKELAQRFFEEACRRQKRGELQEAEELYKKSIECVPDRRSATPSWAGPIVSWAELMTRSRSATRLLQSIRPSEIPTTISARISCRRARSMRRFPGSCARSKAPRYESYCYPHANLGRPSRQNGSGRAPRGIQESAGAVARLPPRPARSRENPRNVQLARHIMADPPEGP